MILLDQIQQGVMCSLAGKYSAKGDGKEFNSYYGLFKKAQTYAKEHRDEAAITVTQRIKAIKLICDEVPKGDSLLSTNVRPRMVPNAIPGLPDVNLTGMVGLGVVKRLPADGRYVVFSDHHMTDNGNRQNFFAVENKIGRAHV